MADDKLKSEIENEFLKLLISATKKGMTVEEFFGVADITLDHLKGSSNNETIAKIISGSASPEDVDKMLGELPQKKDLS